MQDLIRPERRVRYNLDIINRPFIYDVRMLSKGIVPEKRSMIPCNMIPIDSEMNGPNSTETSFQFSFKNLFIWSPKIKSN